jgi:hypothetical protein
VTAQQHWRDAMQFLHAAYVFRSVGQQRHVPCLFKRYAETALMFGASSRLASRFNFATIRNVAFHETVGIFIINFTHMVVTKLAYFAARCTLAAPAWTFATRV